MTSAHFIFIPAVAILGVLLGFFLGARAARDAYAMDEKKKERRAAARAEREARAKKDGP